jgi:hypothetical protein
MVLGQVRPLARESFIEYLREALDWPPKECQAAA